MKERLNSLMSEAGESVDYLRSDIRNLGRYLAELEELIESYRTFAVTLTPSTPTDRAALRKLLKRTQKIVGPPLEKPEDAPGRERPLSTNGALGQAATRFFTCPAFAPSASGGLMPNHRLVWLYLFSLSGEL